MPLPSGTVTFLFTDIEGSTRLWEEHPEAMRLALARHDALLRQAIEDNAGVVFKTIGDAFCATFATAPNALIAALAAQLALHAEAWPDALVLRVRMALHTGAAELRDNDYFGQPLNRVTRLLVTGHGGQILLSAVVQDLTRDTLPPSATLLPLGEHRLRDLGRPEPVFQLLHPDLPATFPPLRSLDNPDLPNNLPQQMTSFIGREKESGEVKALLSRTRLLTLVGSGGCGKTRLCLQVAANLLDNYPDGTWFVELAPLTEAALVPQTLAQVLNVTEEAGKTITQTLIAALKTRTMLLVLDNCEHVLDACARLIDSLLRACPHLIVLATSREGLGIAGEQMYRLPSLSLPDTKQAQTLQSVTQYEAARLFIERSLAALPAFAVTNQNAPALASICQRLDGIPLAIELAAARIRSLSVEEINTRLDNRFRLLTGGSRTSLPRQQTLRALIDWSYDLLKGQEKILLRRLSVFAGGWSLEAAEQVGVGESKTGEGIEEWEIFDLLTSLADKSLVLAQTQGEIARYRLLETVRQYARDRLIESGESETARSRHLTYFLAYVEQNSSRLQGPEAKRWLDHLEREHDNLRAALEWSVHETTPEGVNSEVALRLVEALWWFWEARGYATEGRKWLADALSSADTQTSASARANALHGAGTLARVQGDYVAARLLHEQSRALFEEAGHKQGSAGALVSLGNVAYLQGDLVASHDFYEQGLRLFQELGHKHGIGSALNNLGNVAYERGDYATSQELHEQGLNLFQELEDARGIASSLMSLGIARQAQGHYTVARTLLEQSLERYREVGNKRGIAHALFNLSAVVRAQGDDLAMQLLCAQSLTLFEELGHKGGIANARLNLGELACKQGDYAAARLSYTQGLALLQELGNKTGLAEALEAFAALACRQEQALRAARLWGAAEALREQVGAPLPPSARPRYDSLVAQVRSAAGEDAFAQAGSEGRAMTVEQAIEYALEKGAE